MHSIEDGYLCVEIVIDEYAHAGEARRFPRGVAPTRAASPLTQDSSGLIYQREEEL